MSIGNSGRIVIEVEPEAKRRLYAALALDGLTLKEWFLKAAEIYMQTANQVPLAFGERASSPRPQSTSVDFKASGTVGDI